MVTLEPKENSELILKNAIEKKEKKSYNNIR